MTEQPGRLRRTARSIVGRSKKSLAGRLVAALLVLDMLGNGLLGGSFDETISSRAGRMARQGSLVAKGVCAVLDALDRDHCDKAADNKGG